jgi:hypothetical protein
MKKLLREQMKKVIGGVYASPDEGGGKCTKCSDGTAGAGDSCYFDPDSCSKKCKCGYTCKDKGSELGSKCVAGS